MANTTGLNKRIALSFTCVTNGNNQASIQVNLNEAAVGNNFEDNTQTAGTASWTAVGLGNLSSVDVIALVNLDLSNYVQVAVDNSGAHIIARLQPYPGAPAFLPLDPTTTLYFKANTASCFVQVTAAEP